MGPEARDIPPPLLMQLQPFLLETLNLSALGFNLLQIRLLLIVNNALPLIKVVK